MTLLWVDGFDSYAANGVSVGTSMPTGKYIQASGSSIEANSDTRHGFGQSVQLYNATIRKAFTAQSTIVAGAGYKHGVYVDDDIVFLLESDNLLGTRTEKCRVRINGTGGITVTFGTLDTVLTSEPNLLFPNNWHYVEVKYAPRLDTSGVLQVRVDNSEVITFTGITTASGAETVNVVALPHGIDDSLNGWGINYGYYDDFYVLNTEGLSPLNDFVGDVICYTTRVHDDDGVNQCTQVGGTSGDHFSAVKEATPDADTSYLSTTVNGEREIFGLATLPAAVVDVLAVSVTVRARKDAAGVCNYKIVAQMGAAESVSPDKTLMGTYLNQDFILAEKPGGGAWTPANAQTLKIGFEMVS